SGDRYASMISRSAMYQSEVSSPGPPSRWRFWKISNARSAIFLRSWSGFRTPMSWSTERLTAGGSFASSSSTPARVPQLHRDERGKSCHPEDLFEVARQAREPDAGGAVAQADQRAQERRDAGGVHVRDPREVDGE